jgi:hypothetical protein
MHEQRNDRAIPQGKHHYDWNQAVEIRQWSTEGSIDSSVYGSLVRHQHLLIQLLMGKITSGTSDDPTDPMVDNLAEMRRTRSQVG